MENKIGSFFGQAADRVTELFQQNQAVPPPPAAEKVTDGVCQASNDEAVCTLSSHDAQRSTGDRGLDDQLLLARVGCPVVAAPAKGPRAPSQLSPFELIKEIGTTQARLDQHHGYYPERAADEQRYVELQGEVSRRGAAYIASKRGEPARPTHDQWKPTPMQPGQFEVRTRSYAPFEKFGGIEGKYEFAGDNRGASARLDVTSRITEKTVIDTRDPSGLKLVGTIAYSDPTHKFRGGVLAETGTARPLASAEVRGSRLYQHLEGSNPLVSVAPDIDLGSEVQIRRLHGATHDELEISGRMTGDQFPSAEMLLTDAKGQTLLIHTSNTDGGKLLGPLRRLPGEGHEEMGRFAVTVVLDGEGNFAGVRDPYTNRVMGLEQWNNLRLAAQ